VRDAAALPHRDYGIICTTPPESSPDELLPSSPDEPASLPPPAATGHVPLSGEKHVLLPVSQQQGCAPLQRLPQSESDEQEPAAIMAPLLLPLGALAVGAAIGGFPASKLGFCVACSNGFELTVPELHAATSTRAPRYIEI
jgi:hypothetical protein